MRTVTDLLILGAMLVCTVLACAGARPVPAAKIDVFGVTLGSRVDHKVLRGVEGEKEPCLHGYEYSYGALDLRIAYDERGEIRSLTTRNPANSIFGARVGVKRADAAAALGAEGFTATGKIDEFAMTPLSVRLLVNEGGEVFGIRIEKPK